MAKAFTGYRRRIRIEPAPGRIDVEMEDDCHHFGVTLIHDGETIERVDTREPRHPWTTCPLAGSHLRERMAGVKLAEAADVESQRQHCTHMYDLFVLGARHALDAASTFYDIRVEDPVAGVQLAELDRDAETLLRWRANDPSGQGGIPGGSFRAMEDWSRTLPDAMQEPARMLRRGMLVSGGRNIDFPVGRSAAALLPMLSGVCFTFQPETAPNALRVAGTLRDFSHHPERMLTGESDERRIEGAAGP